MNTDCGLGLSWESRNQVELAGFLVSTQRGRGVCRMRNGRCIVKLGQLPVAAGKCGTWIKATLKHLRQPMYVVTLREV